MSESHRCLAGNACRSSITVDGRREGAPTTSRGKLCDSCHKHVRNAIRQLPQDWQELRDALGERATNTGQRVHSTPTPAIPLSTRKDALMAAIVDWADRAAAVVSYMQNADQPDGRRNTAPKIQRRIKGKILIAGPDEGSPADISEQAVHPDAKQLLDAAIRLVEPNINRLAAAPTEPALMWTKPRRCEWHTELIARLEAFADQIHHDYLRTAYAAAGACDECNGWGMWGQERELTETSGIQIALELVELHNQTRAELGLTRLRHTYTMPCPDCGCKVYRNDGESIVICEGNTKHTCTETEYKVRAGLLLEEEMYTQMGEYLLAESYWRLDRVQGLIDILDKEPTIDEPHAGRVILDHLKQILTDGPEIDGKPIGHLRPEKRAAGTDRKAAMQRQVDQDNWTWRNDKPYQKPPKRRHRKATRAPGAPNIHPGSLTTLVDIDEATAAVGRTSCPQCHTYHAGECA